MRINKQKNLPLKIAGHIFGLIAMANLLRLFFSTEITLSGHVVSMSVSYVGFFIALLLSIWMFKAGNKNNHRGF